MSSHRNEVTLHPVELRDLGKKSPALEAETLKQFQTWLVVPKDQPDQSCYAQRRRADECFFYQSLSDTTPPEFFIDINATLGGAAIRTAWHEFFEVEPANHAAVCFRDREWIFVRRMFAEPRQTRFDRGRLKLGCHHSSRHSGVANLDDRRQIGLNGIPDDQIHGFRFFVGLRLTACGLVAVHGVLACAVAV